MRIPIPKIPRSVPVRFGSAVEEGEEGESSSRSNGKHRPKGGEEDKASHLYCDPCQKDFSPDLGGVHVLDDGEGATSCLDEEGDDYVGGERLIGSKLGRIHRKRSKDAFFSGGEAEVF